MQKDAGASKQLNQSGQNLVRILIASYFLAVSVGFIPGTVATPLTAWLLPAADAELAARVIVFATAYLVLVGAWLRLSALVLANLLFWSSYIGNATAGNVEAFWRDIALIGALMLTYTQTLPRAARHRAALHWTPRVRKLRPSRASETPVTPVMPRRVVVAPRAEAPRPDNTKLMTQSGRDENIFRDDYELALAS
ncbi:hypothetical protein DEA8626_01486 [Defluviimonas aquaemixtae]|uniref:Uncharacterized protein n=1 Tax=Albidovulum aquaemixtae TaxID=1542388 RepID=A0A2R8B5T1_9RHOB|nr:hypothetical protein [Defluviimonas aquaemixtae]SPH17957.1 hypothetical protein DEA8626_01486 [Defluviimonas aquaemixtae]